MKDRLWVRSIDHYFYHRLEQQQQRPDFQIRILQSVMVVVARYSPIAMLVTILFVSLFQLWKHEFDEQMMWMLPTCVIAGGLSRLFSGIVSRVIPRTRPFAMFNKSPLIEHAPNDSFPSNHAAGGFALAVSLYYFVPTIGGLFLLWAVLLAYSRMYVKLHFFSDVLAGSILGVFAARVSIVLFYVLTNH